ncbi:MAG: transglycosylase SLT domain-containing protein [Bdellovibrionia bacterium]
MISQRGHWVVELKRISHSFLFAASLTAGVLVTGCATVKAPSESGRPLANASSSSSSSARTVDEVIQRSNLEQPAPSANSVSSNIGNLGKRVDYGDIVIQGKRLKNTTFDIPVTVNSRVEYWVDYFTGRGRKYFATYLERAEFFIPYMRPILKQNGMPEDLVYLAMIESGFNNFARSNAKAVGPWQFISATGKRYGLMVNWWVDERRDIRKSTIAAVDYLKELMGMFGSFELAAASYNAGEGKLARAIQRFGTKDFWAISRHRFLKPETRDYVPKIIAAALLAKNRTQFGFEPENKVHPGADEAVSSDGEVVKLIKSDKPDDRLEKPADEDGPQNVGDLLSQLNNADMKDDDDDAPEGTGSAIVPATLMVPSDENGASEGVQANNGNDSQPLAKPVPTPHMTRKGEVGGAELAEFDVKSPADLLKVARAAGLSYQTVKSLNPELLRWCTPPNVSSYRIRLPASVKEKFLVTYNHEAYPRQVEFMAYKVRRGETLAHIARHFGIKVDPISDLNGVSPKRPLRHGAKVLLPMPNDRSRSIASLEVRDPPEHRRRKGRRRKHYSKISYEQRREAARAPQGKRSRSRES